jgi:glycerol-3-phosphate O-acyltransferase
MLDEISRAVLSREEVARYLRGDGSDVPDGARDRIYTYLEELKTTQRYPIYRALKHPLYPILRKIERCVEGIDHVMSAVRAGRVVYASNHKSHTDYLVELVVLEDYDVRPPVIAAGINLFGGALGLLHRHVTGAIPIRRNARDPLYLITLRAYVAEVLRHHDLFFYPEGGRSYSGELKPIKGGLLQAALHADCPNLVIVPTAIAYDLVLEDHILARQRVKRAQRPFRGELAEMVRYAVGYKSRAFITFGPPIPVIDYDPHSRRDLVQLSRLLRQRIGSLYKVLPTALVAAAMRPSLTRRDLESRVDTLLDTLRAAHANLGVQSGREAVEAAAEPLELRGVLVYARGRFRVRERSVLRYYARTIEHLIVPPGRTH